MNFQVHPEVAGIAEGLAAVLALVRLHPNVTHEVHVELGGRDKGPGAHAALELLFTPVTLTFGPGVRVYVGVGIWAIPPTVVVAVFISWPCVVSMAGPWRRGGA